MPVLENPSVRVEIDDAFPRVLRTQHKPSGDVIVSADPGIAPRISINGDQRFDAFQIQWGPEGAFTLTAHSPQTLTLRGAVALTADGWIWRIEEAALDGGEVRTLALEGVDFLRFPFGDNYGRDVHIQRRWDIGRGKGLIDRRWEAGAVEGAIPEPAAQKSILAGGWTAFTGACLHSNRRVLPLETQLVEGAPWRTGHFAARTAAIPWRVRGKQLEPFELRAGFFGDLTGDGRVGLNDLQLWFRRQHPDPLPLYRERLWYKVFLAEPGKAHYPYRELPALFERVRLASDGMPQLAYLVGWQYDGHDTGYPAMDRINEQLGTREELLEVFRQGERTDTIVSVHTNVDDAYASNPGFEADLMCRDVNGRLMPWETFHPGLCYHLNHTRDVESGAIFRRLDALLELLPIRESIHIDAFRCTNLSWEPDGFIGLVEEMECGMKPIVEYLRGKGIDPSIEAIDAQGANLLGLFHALYHHSDIFLHFGKILGGGIGDHMLAWALGTALDNDIWHHTDWPTLCNHIYLGAKLYHLYLTDELVHMNWEGPVLEMRFARGGRVECDIRKEPGRLRVWWDGLLVARDNERFLPVGADRIYVYGIHDADQQWTLPATWANAGIAASIITPHGVVEGPELHRSGRDLRIPVMAHRPIRLTRIE